MMASTETASCTWQIFICCGLSDSEPADVYLSPVLSGSRQSGLSVSPPPAASPGFPWWLYTGPDEPGGSRDVLDYKKGAIISGM